MFRRRLPRLLQIQSPAAVQAKTRVAQVKPRVGAPTCRGREEKETRLQNALPRWILLRPSPSHLARCPAHSPGASVGDATAEANPAKE
jgi:hypothetical protein